MTTIEPATPASNSELAIAALHGVGMSWFDAEQIIAAIEDEAVERAYGSRSDARLQRDVDMVGEAVTAEREFYSRLVGEAFDNGAAKERARIAEAVRGLDEFMRPNLRRYVDRAAVLA